MSQELSERIDRHRKIDGYALGSPDGSGDEENPIVRPRKVLDDVIEKAISKLPAQTRLYPEVYAWKITEAVEKYYRGGR